MTPFATTLSCVLLLVAAPTAQQADDASSKVDVRVTTTSAGSVIVDRGSADGIVRGDRVVLHPKDGKSYEGVVDQPLERISRVELADENVTLATGTRGEVFIAKARVKKKGATVKPKPTAAADETKAPPKKRSATTKTPLTAPADVKPAKAGSATVKAPTSAKAPTGEKAPTAGKSSTSGKKPAPAVKAPAAATDGAKPATDGAKTGAGDAKPTAGKKGAPPTARPKSTAKSGQEKPAAPATKPAAKKTTTKKPAAATNKKEAEAAGHSPWKTTDEGWSKDKPLLSQLKPLRPEERSTTIHGLAWALFDTSHFDESDGSNSVFRTGTRFDLENPFDEGGAIHFDAELNHFEARSDGADFHLLARRLSYSKGGTRFDANRWEVGRFLQDGMPEFGYLDGAEWGHRSSDGTRFGASVGYMPEPDEDFSSFKDLQFAAWYQWAADESERLTIAGGFQKTFHEGDSDRDLLVLKGRYLPGDGWDFHCANWVDHYGAGDDAKDASFELTQAVWTLGKRYDDGDWWDVTYRKIAFPDLDREGEFDPITANAIEDNRLNRIMLSGSTWWSKQTRLHASAGVWADEDENGGTGDAGIEWDGFFVDDARMDLTAFGTHGQFTDVLGGRFSWGGFLKNGRWDVFYELSNHQNDGFDLELKDLLQHRLYATRSLFFPSGWMVSATAGALLIDEELAWSLGLYVQKSF